MRRPRKGKKEELFGKGQDGAVGDEEGLEGGVGLQEGAGGIGADDHEVGREGVCLGGGGGDYRSAKEIMLDGTAGAGVDGVGILLSVADVEFTVVAGGDNSAVTAFRRPDLAYVFAGAVVAVDGVVDADRPTLAGGVEAAAADFADVDEHVRDAMGLECCIDEVAAITLGYGVEIKYWGRSQDGAGEATGLGSDEVGGRKREAGADQRVDDVRAHETGGPAGGESPGNLPVRRELVGRETETPDVEQRPAGGIEGSVAKLPHFVGEAVDFGEHGGEDDLLATVQAAEEGVFVVAGEGEVDLIQERVREGADLLRLQIAAAILD